MVKSKGKSFGFCSACGSRQKIDGVCRICGFMSVVDTKKPKVVSKRKKRKKASKKSK